MRIKRLWASLVTLALIFHPVSTALAEVVTIPGGTAVMLKLAETVSSGTHKKGDPVKMEVVSDVLVQGKVVIAKGTAVTGMVEDAAKKFFAGIGGYLSLSVQSVPAINGTLVPVEFTKESKGETTLTSIICTVVCCCLFLLMKGEDVSEAEGTLLNAKVVSNVELQI